MEGQCQDNIHADNIYAEKHPWTRPVAKIFFLGGGGGGGGVERYGSVDSRVPRSLAMENEWGTLEF